MGESQVTQSAPGQKRYADVNTLFFAVPKTPIREFWAKFDNRQVYLEKFPR